MDRRVGGNVQDLFTRVLCAVLGALWGCLSIVAGNGSPYVTAAFALIFMVPMIYRFTQSTHPVSARSWLCELFWDGWPLIDEQRSGFVGCISFTVVSLTEHSHESGQSPVVVAASRGGAIAVGVVASIVANWIIWPFVARHDLRKAISMMLFYCSIMYRSESRQILFPVYMGLIVARYRVQICLL